MDNILEIRNLKKDFGDFALKDISFSLEKGYIMGFIGPNGAGKSTTIKLIMNLIRRDAGEIEVFGLDNREHELTVKERIGFVYDESHYYEELTINEMKRIIARFYKQWDDSIFNKYLREFGLQPDKKIKNLSKGMKMKFSLAAAISHNAELIIMDEPTSGLDPIFRNEILDILRDLLQDENKGVLFSTHITTDLDKAADYITFIHNGELVLTGSKESIIEKYGVVKGGQELLDRDTRKEFLGMRETGFGFEALTGNVERVRKLFGGSVIIERPSLEDIMLYTVRGSANA
ncbi:ABC transporter ATP-binding protein [Phosphitispora fastidiosa]|uniref:ABC transporter ATP-binding protein n=1 Tax=Phosphitispora fastidiosa TaxID=2837202 RepID=UPI001E58980F|nr:ABC transporter ATP-binding protein [Phosphitispora fastidiosa]MBU7006449.1 ABC-2 type transport system ATP-binding protein [Phosphitispora fastidiosa]